MISEAENVQVEIIVKDLGIPINKVDQEKVFERFYRVRGKNETTFSGFGIGLFIAKKSSKGIMAPFELRAKWAKALLLVLLCRWYYKFTMNNLKYG